VEGVAEGAEEEGFGGEFEGAAGAVGQPGLGAQEDGDAEGVGGEDAVEGIDAGVAVDPEGVGLEALKGAEDGSADGAGEGEAAGVAEAGQELGVVAFEQGCVPGDFDAEALVLVAADGEVGAEEDGEVDVGFAGDAAKQRCLVLDGMADEIGQPDRSCCGERTGLRVGICHGVLAIEGQGQDDRDQAEYRSEAVEGKDAFEDAVWHEDEIVGLEIGIRRLAFEDLLHVERGLGAASADGADDAQVGQLGIAVDAAADGDELGHGEGRVGVEGDDADGLEAAQDVHDADSGDDDGISGMDGDVGEAALQGVVAEVDDDRIGDTWTVDGDDVAGGWWEATAGCEDIEEASIAVNRDDASHLADEGDCGIWAVGYGDQHLGIAIHSVFDEPVCEQRLCLCNAEAAKVDLAYQGQVDAPVGCDANGWVVVAIAVETNGDDVADRDDHVLRGRVEDGIVGRQDGGAIDLCAAQRGWPVELSEQGCGQDDEQGDESAKAGLHRRDHRLPPWKSSSTSS
jgi:hypothetical protein